MNTKTYVEFKLPGIFMSEYSVQEVASRDIADLKVLDNAFAFQFFDVISTETDDGTILKSGRLNLSPLHYYGGKVLSSEDAIKEAGEGSIMAWNIEANHWDQVIVCRTGNWQPFSGTDVWIPIESESVE